MHTEDMTAKGILFVALNTCNGLGILSIPTTDRALDALEKLDESDVQALLDLTNSMVRQA